MRLWWWLFDLFWFSRLILSLNLDFDHRSLRHRSIKYLLPDLFFGRFRNTIFIDTQMKSFFLFLLFFFLMLNQRLSWLIDLLSFLLLGEQVSDPGEKVTNKSGFFGLINAFKQLSFHFLLKPLVHFDLKVSLEKLFLFEL